MVASDNDLGFYVLEFAGLFCFLSKRTMKDNCKLTRRHRYFQSYSCLPNKFVVHLIPVGDIFIAYCFHGDPRLHMLPSYSRLTNSMDMSWQVPRKASGKYEVERKTRVVV